MTVPTGSDGRPATWRNVLLLVAVVHYVPMRTACRLLELDAPTDAPKIRHQPQERP